MAIYFFGTDRTENLENNIYDLTLLAACERNDCARMDSTVSQELLPLLLRLLLLSVVAVALLEVTALCRIELVPPRTAPLLFSPTGGVGFATIGEILKQ
jgi:hypothetical protein